MKGDRERELNFTGQPGYTNNSHLKQSPPSSSFPAGEEPRGAGEEPKSELQVNFTFPSIGMII